jgi:hypothetical protein
MSERRLAQKWLKFTVPVTLVGLLGVGGDMLANQKTENEVSKITGSDNQDAQADKNINEVERKYLSLFPSEKAEINRQLIALETDRRRTVMLTQLFLFHKTPEAFQPYIKRAVLDEDVGCEGAVEEKLIMEKLDFDVDSLFDECHAVKEKIVGYETQPLFAGGPK